MTKKFSALILILVFAIAFTAAGAREAQAQTESEELKLGAGFDVNSSLTYLKGTADVPFSNGILRPSVGFSIFTEGSVTSTMASGVSFYGEALYFPAQWKLELGDFLLPIGAGGRLSTTSVSTTQINQEASFANLDAVAKITKDFKLLDLNIWTEAGLKLRIGRTALTPTFGIGIWF